jgi:hypothetical protein
MLFAVLKAFIKNNWNGIVVAVFVAVIALSFHHLKNQRDSAVAELATLKAVYNAEVIEFTKKLDAAKANEKLVAAQIAEQLANLKIDKETLTNAIRSYYANKPTERPMVRATVSMLPPPACSSFTDTTTDTQESAISEPITGTACIGLEAENKDLTDALALETLYFNQARERVDQDCEQIGCQNDQ